jgi:Protein of unknown function (DUF4232)
VLALVSVAACGAPGGPQNQAAAAVRASSSQPHQAPAVPSTSPSGTTPELKGQGDSGPRCRTHQLALKFAGAQGAAGTSFLTFRLANTDAAPCLAGGFVGMRMLDAAGEALPTRVVRNGGFFANQPPPSRFALRPSGSGSEAATAATFQVAYSHVPRAGEAPCPDAFQLVVTPPDEVDHLVVAVQGWTLAPCNRGELDVTPLRPPGVAGQ